MAGELSGGELRKLYTRDFVVFEAESPGRYPAGHELRKLTGRSYTPVWVMLDSNGRKVLENSGFRNPREARALHQFISTRAYQKSSYEDFLASYPQK